MAVKHNIAITGPTKEGGDYVNKKPTIEIHVEFTGGLELLFSNKRQHKVALPCTDDRDQVANLAFLVQYLCDNLMKDRRNEMFVLDGTVSRPGILVLVNDADWELEGGDQYELQENDAILFVSTLHGG